MLKAACSVFFRTIRSVRLTQGRLGTRTVPLAFVCGITSFASAQTPDSIAVDIPMPDSMTIAPALLPDSTVATPIFEKPLGPPLEQHQYPEGTALDSVPIARIYEPDVIERLDAHQGNFRYSMSQLGWPDEISLQGHSPLQTGVTLDGIPLQDPVTSRALFESLPFDLLGGPRTVDARHGRAVGVAFESRRFDVRAPRTELRYRVGGPGLQSISGVHVQQRRSRLFGAPSVVQILFRYASGKWEGDFPDSSSDVTQMDGRIGFQAERWILRLDAFLSRRHGGAHSGVVVPDPNNFDTIYQRFNARVNNPNATFRSKRSDLRLTYDRKWSDALRPLSLQFGWAANVRRYRDASPAEALIHEYTVAASQELPAFVPNQYMGIRFRTRFDDVRSATIFADTTDLGRSNVEALLETDLSAGSLRLTGHVGVTSTAGYSLPALNGSLELPFMGLGVKSGLSWSARAPSRLELAGSQSISSPGADAIDAEKTFAIFLELDRSLGSSQVSLKTFVNTTQSALDVLSISTDSFLVTQSTSTFVRTGVITTFGWRDRLERGFYATVHSTLQGSNAPADDALLQALDASIPSFHGRLRVGTRYLLFQGDLNIDLSVIGRYWSSFRSRRYEPVTGVLTLTDGGSPDIGNSGTVDVRLEAGIRTASVFVGMENVLARSTYPGAMLVPYYPLTARAFRFGIFWPIDN